MILEQLSNAPGVSGNEEAVRRVVLKAIKPHVDEWRVDTVGNVLAVKKARRRSPAFKVMIAAHMDEVGFMIVGHNSGGWLRFKAVGGIDAHIWPGKVVLVGPDQLPGVIGVKPVHLLDDDEETETTKAQTMVIDIGAAFKEEAERLVRVGQYANFATRYRRLGRVVTGKAFDDRAGCAVLIELLRGERFNFDLHAAFTVQEEVGQRGARVAAFAIEPDCAFVLEGTICDDLPKDKDSSPTTELGRGPALSVMDRSMFSNRSMIDHVVATAEELGLPYQFKQPGIGGTDAGATTRSKGGVPSLPVSVPCRYIHTPIAMLSLEDFRNTVRLMRESLKRLRPEVIKV